MSADWLLVVGAGALQVPLIREAQQCGLSVLATDGNPEAPGAAVADAFECLDTYDLAGHQQLAASRPLVGVVTAGADVAPTVSAAAEAGGVRGIPLAVAQCTHNKALVRQGLRDAGFDSYQPAWEVGERHAPRGTACGFPCVVKPLSQRASRGVTLVPGALALPAAVRVARQYGDRYLIEARLHGTEHSVEAILGDGHLYWFNIVDRHFTYQTGVPIEIGHSNPTTLPLLARDRCKVMLLAIASALGVTWGPFKLDILWTHDGPKLLEATARLSGGWDSQGTSPLTGRHPLRQLIQLACGWAVDPQHAPAGAAACAAILPQRHGTVLRLPPLPATLTDVARLHWAITPGTQLAPPTHCADRAGFVLHWAETPESAWETARACAQWLAARIEVRP